MKYFIPVLVLLIAIFACSKEETVEVGKTQEKRNALVAAIYSEEIHPNLNDLGVLLLELKEQYVEFSGSEVTSVSKFDLQNKWLDVALSAGKCKLFNVTPVSRLFYFNKIHTSPVSEDFLESISVYQDTSVLDVSTFPTNRKGLAVLEYLFFEEESLASYNTLVISCIDDLILNQQALLTYWEQELESDFVSGETISINDGYGELINSFVNTIEVSRKERYEQPFGLSSGQLYDFEAQRSGNSKVLFDNSFSYLEYLISDYYCSFLVAEGENELADDLNTAFKAYDVGFSLLGENSFEDSRGVISVESLEAFEDAISDVLVVIKVELASSYEVLISFSDADGD